jgi:hypothetical protein
MENEKFNEVILTLLRSEYVIFLTNKFYSFFKKSLLKYFDKYDIYYINYNTKSSFITELNKFNTLVKNVSLRNKNIVDLNLKLKLIYFFENNIEPNTLYKKITFSKESLFLSFENYLIKKMEYKLRTFCQIAEKLGAETIRIKYDSKTDNKSTINIGIDTPSNNISGSMSSHSEKMGHIDLMFKYSNFHHNLNLNKFYIIELIENETEFFISKEEFYADIDLKFLIDARCLNLIQLYNTKIIINHVNELEKRIFVKALSYGLELGVSTSTNDFISLSISIDFIDIYKNPDCINGSNLYINKEGFWHLSNIIKQEILNDKTETKDKLFYGKIINFLEAHLINFEKTINNANFIMKFNDILKLSFTYDQFNTLSYDFFKDNFTFNNFEKFRNIIIYAEHIDNNIFRESNSNINKLYFIALQYNKIIKCNKLILSQLEKYISKAYIMLIENIGLDNHILKLILNKISIYEILDIVKINKDTLCEIIKNAYIESYMIWYGIRQPVYDTIYSDAEAIINNDFENKFIKIIMKLNYKITENRNIRLEINKVHTNNIIETEMCDISMNHNLQKSQKLLKNPQTKTIRRISNEQINLFNINNKIEICIESQSEKIIKFIVFTLLKNVESQIITYYDSNYGGYLSNIISNLLIKYFTIKYDKNIFNIFTGGFFKNNMFLSHKDISDKFELIIELFKAKSNYQQYKIFYTWEDFQMIIKYFEENYVTNSNNTNNFNNSINLNTNFNNFNKKNKKNKNKHPNDTSI